MALELGTGPEAQDGVIVLADRLMVQGWMTTDSDIVRHFQDLNERIASDPEAGTLGGELERALRISALALRGVAIDTRVDFVEREFLRVMGKMESAQDKREKVIEDTLVDFLEPEDGQLAKELKTYLGQGGRLAELFDPKRTDSAFGHMRQLLGEFMEGRGSKLARMLDLTNPESPLSPLRDDWQREFNNLRKQIEDFRKELATEKAAATATATEAEKGTGKGRVYQEAAFEVINLTGRVFGDVAEGTWDEKAINGSKDGDVVVSVHGGAATPVRIVFEARDGCCGLTKIGRDLSDAREARQARVGIGVYSKAEYMPRGTAPFAAISTSDFLVLLDKETLDDTALQLAYRIARWQAVRDSSEVAETVDTEALRADVDEAVKLLKGITDMKSKLTQLASAVTRSVDGLSGDADALRRSLTVVFERMDTRLACQ